VLIDLILLFLKKTHKARDCGVVEGFVQCCGLVSADAAIQKIKLQWEI